MYNRRIIMYAVEKETGLVISRVDGDIAVPMLQWDRMLPENGFAAVYELEKMSVDALTSTWRDYRWTKKVPVEIKNQHREFWGMKRV